MEEAFEEAVVEGFDGMLNACDGLPDPDDAHVVAATLKTQAAVIVTDNLRDFPKAVLAPLNLEVRSTDAFIADTIALDPGRAIAAVRTMRERLRNPEKTPDAPARYGGRRPDRNGRRAAAPYPVPVARAEAADLQSVSPLM